MHCSMVIKAMAARREKRQQFALRCPVCPFITETLGGSAKQRRIVSLVISH